MDNNQKSESLFELAVILGRQNEFKEILRIVSTKASALVGADVASILMINPQTRGGDKLHPNTIFLRECLKINTL